MQVQSNNLPNSTETFSPIIATKMLEDFHAAMVLTPETLIHTIFSQYDLNNLDIGTNHSGNGYILRLTNKQLNLRKAIEQMENFGYFNSVTYETNEIVIDLNDAGSDLFLNTFSIQ